MYRFKLAESLRLIGPYTRVQCTSTNPRNIQSYATPRNECGIGAVRYSTVEDLCADAGVQSEEDVYFRTYEVAQVHRLLLRILTSALQYLRGRYD